MVFTRSWLICSGASFPRASRALSPARTQERRGRHIEIYVSSAIPLLLKVYRVTHSSRDIRGESET